MFCLTLQCALLDKRPFTLNTLRTMRDLPASVRGLLWSAHPHAFLCSRNQLRCHSSVWELIVPLPVTWSTEWEENHCLQFLELSKPSGSKCLHLPYASNPTIEPSPLQCPDALTPWCRIKKLSFIWILIYNSAIKKKEKKNKTYTLQQSIPNKNQTKSPCSIAFMNHAQIYNRGSRGMVN